ncbi:MAG: YfhO family protein [Eubacteriales bacterium]|nr:YfhO family protein [Eubacteriales bacterium]
MQKDNSKIVKIVESLLSPLAVFGVLIIYFYIKDMYPFGPDTLASVDMKQQVIPLMLQWKEILTNEQSVFLNSLNSGGSSFWGIFFFFVSSPFSLITLIVDSNKTVLFMNIIVASKMTFAAYTSGLFYRKAFPRSSSFNVFLISFMYALSGFSLMFFQNLIWLDFVILFPLLMLGLNELFSKGKVILYFIVLTLMLFTSYYLSYMIAIFVILYTGLNIRNTAYDNRQVSGKIIVSSLMSVALTSFVWLPSLNEYLISARTTNIVNSLTSGSFITYYETTTGILLSTSLLLSVYPLLITSYWERGFPKNRILILFALSIVPIFIEPVNKMWHTGNYQAFPARYGYITVFLGLYLAMHFLEESHSSRSSLCELPAARRRSTIITGSIFASAAVYAVILHTKYMSENKLNEMARYAKTLWGDQQSFILMSFSFLFIGAVYYLLIVLRKSQVLPKTLFIALMLLALFSETYLNLEIYVGTPSNNADNYHSIFDLKDRIDDNEFYRVKPKTKYFDVNLVGAIGYNSLSSYTSLTPEKYLFTMKKLGYSSYWMEVNSSHSTDFIDALMVNRYEISDSMPKDDSNRSIIYSNADYFIAGKTTLKYPAFVIDEAVFNSLSKLEIRDRTDLQNEIYKQLLNTDTELFRHYESTETDGITYDATGKHYVNLDSRNNDDSGAGNIYYDIQINNRQKLYFDLFDRISANLVEHINESVNIYVNGELLWSKYPEKNSNGILCLGEYENEIVRIRVEVLKTFDAVSFGLFGMETKQFFDSIRSINESSPIISFDQSENEVFIQFADRNELSRDLPDISYLAVMLPNNGNLKAYSENGSPLQIRNFLDGFTAIVLPKYITGVRLVSVPKGFTEGIIISISAFILIVISMVVDKILRHKGRGVLSRILSCKYAVSLNWIIIVVSVLVFIAVYVFPVVLYVYSTFSG